VCDGLISVRDVDRVLSHGFGMRYAFFGPIETLHMNAEGATSVRTAKQCVQASPTTNVCTGRALSVCVVQPVCPYRRYKTRTQLKT